MEADHLENSGGGKCRNGMFDGKRENSLPATPAYEYSYLEQPITRDVDSRDALQTKARPQACTG